MEADLKVISALKMAQLELYIETMGRPWWYGNYAAKSSVEASKVQLNAMREVAKLTTQ